MPLVPDMRLFQVTQTGFCCREEKQFLHGLEKNSRQSGWQIGLPKQI